MRRLVVAVAGLLLACAAASAETVVVRGAIIHPIAGPAIEDGVLVATDGAIAGVGPASAVPVPEGARVVEGNGLHLWPGLIDAYGQIGLTEIGSVRGTVDTDESGVMNPNARAEVALNASSSHLPVARANGILLAAAVPTGGIVAGSAATVALDGYTYEELVRRAPSALAIDWPAMLPKPPKEESKEEPKEPPPGWQEDLARLEEMLREARSYAAARKGGATSRDADVRWESLVPVVEGKVPLLIRATRLVEIRAALAFAERQGLPMVLADGGDGTAGEAWRCAEELAARKVPVVLQCNRVPLHRHDPYDAPFVAAARLHEKGVTIAFGSWSSWATRGLPQEAARAVAFGLPREAAERALTLDAARIWGVDARYGSLETGKSATFILVEGDLLDTRMQVRRAFLDGRELELTSRHTELWKHWSARPARKP